MRRGIKGEHEGRLVRQGGRPKNDDDLVGVRKNMQKWGRVGTSKQERGHVRMRGKVWKSLKKWGRVWKSEK